MSKVQKLRINVATLPLQRCEVLSGESGDFKLPRLVADGFERQAGIVASRLSSAAPDPDRCDQYHTKDDRNDHGGCSGPCSRVYDINDCPKHYCCTESKNDSGDPHPSLQPATHSAMQVRYYNAFRAKYRDTKDHTLNSPHPDKGQPFHTLKLPWDDT